MSYEVKILADSVSRAGHRITSLMATFPRLILAEVNTTRMFGRNSASSRAIPVERKIRSVLEDMFVPAAFGTNQKGMQPGAALEGQEAEAARLKWVALANTAIDGARVFAALGVHKQYANRVLEPYAWHTAIITATDWQNHEHQRVNPAAQGEYQTLAEMIRDAIRASTPIECGPDDWHLPLVRAYEDFPRGDERELRTAGYEPAKISAARCARVSFMTHEGKRDFEADAKLYADTLAAKGHMSPLEHPARPMDQDELRLTRSYDISLVDGPTLRIKTMMDLKAGGEIVTYSGRRVKLARVRGPLHYAGPFNGWISQRMLVHGEEDILGYREEEGQS